LKVGVVGCGLIGKRRAQVAQQSGADDVVIVADVDEGRAKALAGEIGCLAAGDWRDVIERDDLEAVVVATPNKFLMPVSVAALESGKHILCEKPLGRNFTEAQAMVAAAQKAGRVLKVGFNHRHHPAIWKAHEICERGEIGTLMFIRAVYGHGGRPGYDKEWRGDAELSGGGELLDQSVHLVDLCRWFLAAGPRQGGDFSEAVGFINTFFWDLGYFSDACHCEATHFRRSNLLQDEQKIASQGTLAMTSLNRNPQLEDNAFAMLRTPSGQVAQFHSSWTQWKNRFSFEVFGKDGYVRVEGLGGSYGTERLEVGKRRIEGGAPEVEVVKFPGPDLSWQAEWQEFTSAIREGRQPLANGEDGLQTMRTIAAIYESAQTGRVVPIKTSS
jgi:predicted dehydrogenase